MGKVSNYIKTLYKFFNKFGDAYVQNAVPTGAKKPYLTYTVDMDDYFKDGVLQVTIYTNSNLFLEVSEIAEKILDEIGHGYKLNMEEGGYIYLKPNGMPFQLFVDEGNTNSKNAYIVFDKQIMN